MDQKWFSFQDYSNHHIFFFFLENSDTWAIVDANGLVPKHHAISSHNADQHLINRVNNMPILNSLDWVCQTLSLQYMNKQYPKHVITKPQLNRIHWSLNQTLFFLTQGSIYPTAQHFKVSLMGHSWQIIRNVWHTIFPQFSLTHWGLGMLYRTGSTLAKP